MRAMQIENADLAGCGTEHDEILTEDSGAQRQLSHLGRHGDGLPVAAQQLSASRTPLDVGEVHVLLRNGFVVVRAVGDVQRLSP